VEKRHGKAWLDVRTAAEDGYEPDGVGTQAVPGEPVLGHQGSDLCPVADNDLGFEGQAPPERRDQVRAPNPSLHDERARSADVHEAQIRQLRRQHRGSEDPVAPDVYAPEKNDQRDGGLAAKD
jgi:hypothetical protein